MKTHHIRVWHFDRSWLLVIITTLRFILTIKQIGVKLYNDDNFHCIKDFADPTRVILACIIVQECASNLKVQGYSQRKINDSTNSECNFSIFHIIYHWAIETNDIGLLYAAYINFKYDIYGIIRYELSMTEMIFSVSKPTKKRCE